MSAQIPDAFASAFNPVDFDPNAFDPAEAFNSMFELMDGMSNAIIIQVAMDEELAAFTRPILERTSSSGTWSSPTCR